jgi:glutamate/tyrosine decarboxylase-like PLP-dependent enzyme
MSTVALRSQILAHEKAAASLEPPAALRAEWQHGVDEVIARFLDGLPGLATYAPPSPMLRDEFDQAVSHHRDPGALLTQVSEALSRAGLQAAGPGHLAFVPGGGIYVGAIADHFAAALNHFTADSFTAPIATSIHNQAVSWLTAMVGYGDEAWGDITSGGTHATLTALTVARNAHRLRPRDYERVCVYLTEHTHHCCHKVLDVIFGDAIVIRRVASRNHAMDTEALQEAIAQDRQQGLIPWLIVATAGSTHLGKVDDLEAIAAIAERFRLWLHVDAAYGGFFILCPERKAMLAGLSRADSIVLDPHKGMFLPYGCGAVLIKQGNLLRQAFGRGGAYLQDRTTDTERSPMDYSLELTRPFRALRLWLALKVHGEEVFRRALQEKLALARYTHERLAGLPGLRMVGAPDLSIVAFSVEHPELEQANRQTRELLQRINRHPEAFLSSTLIDGRFVIRVAILSFRTHLATIDALLETITNELARLTLLEASTTRAGES